MLASNPVASLNHTKTDLWITFRVRLRQRDSRCWTEAILHTTSRSRHLRTHSWSVLWSLWVYSMQRTVSHFQAGRTAIM